ncbi:MAG: M23 family metallopeptidase [Alphaproteobacteria bacterium]|nr:M23 family metallopeptidase [Alphaproteobacteria bacterium]
MARPRRIVLIAAVSALFTHSANAADPRFDLPIDCAVTSGCLIQNHVDHGAGGSPRDYACGGLTYGQHKGTDFRLPDLAALDQPVEVRAAAPGRVVGTRNAQADRKDRRKAVHAKGQECGNGVRLDHGSGWESQYCHLKRGSVRVKVGKTVAAGEVLGLVGLSGLTEFPHVHFEVRKDGRTIDPFLGRDSAESCGVAKGALWSETALAALAYRESALLAHGFSDRKIQAEDVRRGGIALPRIADDAKGLTFYAGVMGIRPGDAYRIRIIAPDGRVLVEDRPPAASAVMADLIGVVSLERREGRFPPGTYRGEYRLRRNNVVIVSVDASIEVVASGR